MSGSGSAASSLALLAALASTGGVGCGRHEAHSGPDATLVAVPKQEPAPAPRKNMKWIPKGILIAGTKPGDLPRMADQEMPGVGVELHGFYIDVYPYPNEPGAIQTTNVSRDEAQELCRQKGKRLCTELEWERACKGADNTTYEYGNRYEAEVCAVAAGGHQLPSGTHAACHSSFGVFDMHGGAREWTSSNWNRDGVSALAVVRGGAGEPGEVYGRCANASSVDPRKKYPNVGFRCCAGEPNKAQVHLQVVRSARPIKSLKWDADVASAIEAQMPEAALRILPKSGAGAFRVTRLWRWYPIGNEELTLAGGCGHPGLHATCGLVVVRMEAGKPKPLAFAESGWWVPTVQLDADRRVLWVYGGDSRGKYRRRVSYLWGRVGVFSVDRTAGVRHQKIP